MPNTDVLGPIQQAMYDVMAGDAALADDAAVYDEVSDGASYPYVVLGEATGTPDGAHDRFGQRTTETLHAWSTYHGYAELHTIVGHLLRLFDEQLLTVEGHDFVSSRHEQTVLMRDPDPDLRHAVVRFAIETEHPA